MWSVWLLCLVLSCASALPYIEHSRRHHRKQNSEYESSLPMGDDLKKLMNIKYEIQPHEFYNEVKPVRCSDDRCPRGMQCVYDTTGEEICICGAAGSCPPGHGLTCGSDGNLYDSHCELHRVSCETNRVIKVDRTGRSCLKADVGIDNSFEVPDEHHTLEHHTPSKKKDLSQVAEKYGEPTRQKNEILKEVKSSTALAYPTVSPMVKDEKRAWCTSGLFDDFKQLLIEYHCNRLALLTCHNKDMEVRSELLEAMFLYYDINKDEKITAEELFQFQNSDHLDKISHVCTLSDFLSFKPDELINDFVSKPSFFIMFNEMIPSSALEERLNHQIMTMSDNIRHISIISDGSLSAELSCMVVERSTIRWTRNGHTFDPRTTNDYVAVSSRLLLIRSVTLAHIGNYSCYDELEPKIQDYMQLIVQIAPIVKTQNRGKMLEGATTSLTCHTYGVPEPSVTWLIDSYNLPDDSKRYDWTNQNTTVQIISPNIKMDSGVYYCLAKSEVGWTRAPYDLTVISKQQYLTDSKKFPDEKQEYIIFHNKGYTVYSAEHCSTSADVPHSASNFKHYYDKGEEETLGTLCRSGQPCVWGPVVNVRDMFIYASQPTESRIVVIDVSSYRPAHVILFEQPVTRMSYQYETDELWILTGAQKQFQVVMTLPLSSKGLQFEPLLLLPYHTIFDAVDQLFIPGRSLYNTPPLYAYATHFNDFILSRIDISSKNYSGHADLSEWSCLPINVKYLTVGGIAVVECEDHEVTLLIDTITNSVLNKLVGGHVTTSPNHRYAVIRDSGRDITIYHQDDLGNLTEMYGYESDIVIKDIIFLDSKMSKGYDLAITSQNGRTVEFLDIRTKKAQLLGGLKYGSQKTLSKSYNPSAIPSGEFNQYLLDIVDGALFLINRKYHYIACEWTHIVGYQTALWIN